MHVYDGCCIVLYCTAVVISGVYVVIGCMYYIVWHVSYCDVVLLIIVCDVVVVC